MSRSRIRSLVAILVAALLPINTITQVCGDDYPLMERSHIQVTSQEILDRVASECTTIDGHLLISYDYDGPFFLPNVTNITSGLSVDWGYFKPRPPITSIDLPDLTDMQTLDMNPLETLARVSIPKLTYIRRLTLQQPSPESTVELFGLENAESMQVYGNYSSITFNALKNATSFIFCNKNCFPGEPTGPPQHSTDLFLPALEVARNIWVQGKVSSFAVPKLAKVNSDKSWEGMALQFADSGDPIALSFPNLDSVNDYNPILHGPIESLSLPKLLHSTGYWDINTSVPLNVDLPIVSFEGLTLTGEIESVKLPGLRSFSGLAIESKLPLDCGAVEREIDSQGAAGDAYFRCESTFVPPKGMSKGAKIGIGVGVAVAGLTIILGVVVFIKRRRGKRAKPGSGTEIQLATMNGQEMNTAPPPYAR